MQWSKKSNVEKNKASDGTKPRPWNTMRVEIACLPRIQARYYYISKKNIAKNFDRMW